MKRLLGIILCFIVVINVPIETEQTGSTGDYQSIEKKQTELTDPQMKISF